MAKPKGVEPVPKAESEYTKDQLLKSMRYRHRRDLLEAVLDADKTYSHAEVEKITANFMKGTVK